MYEEYFGFKEKPFQIVPNPDYLYLSPKHENALTHLEYGLTEKVGFLLMTGEVGSGKTTLIRYLLNKIGSNIETAVLFNTSVTSSQLLMLILQEFELTAAKNNKAANLEILNKYLIEKYSQGKQVLLIIDEAQNLSRETLEEVRMISNLQTDDDILLQIMLVGQPELKDRLSHPDLTQFSQRIAVNYHLEALSHEETRHYITHRLNTAGGKTDIFKSETLDVIYKASGGVPRTINLLCDSALIYGFADELEQIEPEIIDKAIKELRIIGTYKGEARKTKDINDEKRKASSRGYVRRFQNLERSFYKFQAIMESKIEEFEKRANHKDEELVHRLKKMLEEERNRCDNLLAENARLKHRLERQIHEQESSGYIHQFDVEE